MSPLTRGISGISSLGRATRRRRATAHSLTSLFSPPFTFPLSASLCPLLLLVLRCFGLSVVISLATAD